MYPCMAGPVFVAAATSTFPRWLRYFAWTCAALATLMSVRTVSRAGIPIFFFDSLRDGGVHNFVPVDAEETADCFCSRSARQVLPAPLPPRMAISWAILPLPRIISLLIMLREAVELPRSFFQRDSRIAPSRPNPAGGQAARRTLGSGRPQTRGARSALEHGPAIRAAPPHPCLA